MHALNDTLTLCRLFCLPPTSGNDQWWKFEGSETGELNLNPDRLLWARNLQKRPDVQRITRQITTGTKIIKRNTTVTRCNFSFPKLQSSHHISFLPLPSTACHTQTTHHCSIAEEKLHDWCWIPLPCKYIQIFSSFTIFFPAWSNFVVRWREKEALSFHRGRWKPVMKGCAVASKNRD